MASKSIQKRYTKRNLNGRELDPQTLMMSYGYRPEWSEGAIKPPIFQTSTFVIESAEAGKRFFSLAYGLEEPDPDEEAAGLIYGRINNPNLEILEDRLTLYDGGEAALAFGSGMAAITTTMFALLNPGDLILHSGSLYGGTDHFIKHVLPRFDIAYIDFDKDDDFNTIAQRVRDSGRADRLALIYVETPSNPMNALVDLEMCAELADSFSNGARRIPIACDNTFLGPIFQQPIKHGVDLVLYSATKYIGGHSDVVAGAAVGSADLINEIRAMRTFMGTMADPWTCWLLLRSLETLKPRMQQMSETASKVSQFLANHPKVERIYCLGHLDDPRQQAIYEKQCLAPGGMISFDIKGGEAEAFRFLNALKVIKLAVSLGGTESLAEHPFTMTHADVSPEDKQRVGLTDKLIRMSIGLEHPDDLIADLDQALAAV
ncbi:MAG TPA: cystathionine gamma-synthase family protein [Thermomicrobiales bacterium]|nr:cystathionine gamma-synthase family protein [Thermomicrobiales bacterium]